MLFLLGLWGSFFNTDKNEFQRGYEYVESALKSGRSSESLYLEADCPFDMTNFDRGMLEALLQYS